MFKIITIPFDSETKTFHEDVLNKSILNKKIKSYQVNFFQDGENSYWTVFLEYDPVLEKMLGNEACSPDLYGFVVLFSLEFCNHKMLSAIY